MTDSVNYGRDPNPEELDLLAAAGELSPDKSLARTSENAKFLIGCVALVGTLLTGLGLVSFDELTANHWTRRSATVAVASAVASVVLALWLLVLPPQAIRRRNLVEIKEWYDRQLTRGWFLWLSTLLLIIAILMAGTAAVMTAVQDPAATPLLSLQLVGGGTDAKLSARVEAGRLPSGSKVATKIVGLRPGSPELVVFENISMASASGKVSVSGDVAARPGYSRFRLTAIIPGRDTTFRRELIINASSAGHPSVSLQLVGSGRDAKLSAKVEAGGLSSGSKVTTKIVGLRPGSPELVLFRNKSTVDASGKVSMAGDIDTVKGCLKYRLTLLLPSRKPFIQEISL